MNSSMRMVIATTPIRMNLMTTHSHSSSDSVQCTECMPSTGGLIFFLVVVGIIIGTSIYLLMKE